MYCRYNDEYLLNLISKGDKKGLELLFNKYWEPLFSAANYRLQSEELAKDVLQNLFIDLWDKRESINIRSNVKGYLNVALKNRIINKIKAEDVREKYERMAIQFYETNYLATEHQFKEKYLQDEMEKKIEQLPGRCREVFILSRVEQLSHKEIGEQLGISPKTVENHITKALRILKPHLKKIVEVLILLYCGSGL